MPFESRMVAVEYGGAETRYNEEAPYHPAVAYPEYRLGTLSKEPNPAYEMVRGLFFRLGLDRARFGTPAWNPLGELVCPADQVLIKPNMVRDVHAWGMDVISIFTHGSVIRAVLDYVHIALGDGGRIIIGDAPLQSCDFERMIRLNGLLEIQAFYRQRAREVEVVDFRAERAHTVDNYILRKEKLSGPPGGYRVADLGAESLLAPLGKGADRFRVTNYDPAVMSHHHNQEKNEYLIPRVVLESDVVINLPKWKTHRKAGVTNALKNLVGINGHKDWLPHHRTGSVPEGGDEYPFPDPLIRATARLTEVEDVQDRVGLKLALRQARRAVQVLSRIMERSPYREGSWYGNDTIWRTALDLNRLLFYADREGTMRPERQRKYLAVSDGIIAGDHEGPLEPTNKYAGTLVGGCNPVTVDTVACHLMGFDYRKVPIVRGAYDRMSFPIVDCQPNEIVVVSNHREWNGRPVLDISETLGFEPSEGWEGHIELPSRRPDGSATMS